MCFTSCARNQRLSSFALLREANGFNWCPHLLSLTLSLQTGMNDNEGHRTLHLSNRQECTSMHTKARTHNQYVHTHMEKEPPSTPPIGHTHTHTDTHPHTHTH